MINKSYTASMVGKALYIETFNGGSHSQFAQGWMKHSRFEWDFQCLPARHWKWRQAGSALHFTQRIPNSSSSRFPEFMAISGMIDLAHLRAMRPDLPPFLYYCHENQFAYPLSEHEPMDFRYGFTDLASFLASRTVVFNSQYNKDSFIDSLKALFRRLPDAVPSWTLEALQSKSFVVYPGVEEPPEIETCQQSQRERPLIVWNHRHEHDKDPTSAYEILMRAKKLGMEFDFALLGERFTSSPGAFDLLRKDFKSQILVDSFASRDTYRQWLRQGSVVLSTAIQENFGISIVEAALAGCLPLVPKRLAYPEVLPLWSHELCLWSDKQEAVNKLRRLLNMKESERRHWSQRMQNWMKRYLWPARAAELDEILLKTGLS